MSALKANKFKENGAKKENKARKKAHHTVTFTYVKDYCSTAENVPILHFAYTSRVPLSVTELHRPIPVNKAHPSTYQSSFSIVLQIRVVLSDSTSHPMIIMPSLPLCSPQPGLLTSSLI